MTRRVGRWRQRWTRGHCKHSAAGPETSVGPTPGASCPAHSLCPSLPSLSEAFATLQEILVGGLDGNAASLEAPFDQKAGASCGEKVQEPPNLHFSSAQHSIPHLHRSSPTVGQQNFKAGASRVVQNMPANAGDMGSIPGLGRFHTPQSNEARVPQILSLQASAVEPTCCNCRSLKAPEPVFCSQRSYGSEKPVPCS